MLRMVPWDWRFIPKCGNLLTLKNKIEISADSTLCERNLRQDNITCPNCNFLSLLPEYKFTATFLRGFQMFRMWIFQLPTLILRGLSGVCYALPSCSHIQIEMLLCLAGRWLRVCNIKLLLRTFYLYCTVITTTALCMNAKSHYFTFVYSCLPM